MNRSWITGLALAGVAGTAGAAYAGVAAGDSLGTQTQPAPSTSQQSATTTTRTISYQIGAAGTASISVAGGSLTVIEAAGGTGWTVLSATGPATHVEVQFSDTLQLVTFSADLVGDDVVVSLTNVAVEGAPTTVAAAPINVTVITTSHSGSAPGSTASQPTTPAPTASPTTPAPAPAAATPAASTTACAVTGWFSANNGLGIPCGKAPSGA